MIKGWGIWFGAFVLLLFIYATKAILLPFIAGLAVAYLLDPVTDKFEAIKLPRWLAATIVLILFFVGITGIILAIFPLLKAQISALISNLPGYFAAVRPFFEDLWLELTTRFNVQAALEGGNVLESAIRTGLSKLGDILAGFWSGGMAIFNFLGLLLITPVVAFFMLRDWDVLVTKLDSLLPKKNAPRVRMIAQDIDYALGGFVRGQTLAAIIMAFAYGLGWTLVGLEYALVLGLIGGIMAYIPYAGALFTAALAVLIGIGQFGFDWGQLLLVIVVYGLVQLLEGVVLTPNLIGSRIRLHPVWVLFAIFAGGQLMGFVGVLIAIPAAAVIGVLARHMVADYLGGPLHGSKKRTLKKKAVK